MTCKLMSLQASDTFLLKWKTVLKKLASITNIRYDVFFMEGDTSYFSNFHVNDITHVEDFTKFHDKKDIV